MKFDAWRPPSRPDKTFPETRDHGATHQSKTSAQNQGRHNRSAYWFSRNRRSSNVLLHHRHIRTVLAREWSTKMECITATIWASQTTRDVRYYEASERSELAELLPVGAVTAGAGQCHVWWIQDEAELVLG